MQYYQLINRSEKAFPTNKTQLVRCLNKNMCFTRKKNTQTHVIKPSLFHFQMYIRNEWKLVPSQLHVARLRCFQNRFQEPYVMLRYLPSTPLFDERFVDYGCNKVQYIDNLRNRVSVVMFKSLLGYMFLYSDSVICHGILLFQSMIVCSY